MTKQNEKNFYDKVLNSFKEEEFTEEEIRQKQSKWKRHESKPKKVSYTNDFPAYFFAGFWIRGFAFMVDLLCITAIKAIFLSNIFAFFQLEESLLYDGMGVVLYLAYFTLMTKLNYGQTIGKMIFGIRVICMTEEDLSWKTVLIRETFGRYILQVNPLCYLGYLPVIFTKRKQQTIDLLTDTSVVTLNLIQAFDQKANA